MRSELHILMRPWSNPVAMHVLIHRGKSDKEVVGICMRFAKGKANPSTLLEEIWNIKNESPSWF